MTITRTLITLLGFLAITTKSFSQDISLLYPIPSTKEEFVKSESAFIQVVNWLENTPLGQEADKRKGFNALIIEWVTKSPTVTLEINQKVTPMSKKNPDLLAVFLGGWTRYALQNDYSKDEVKGNLSGIKAVITLYKLGGSIKKDKDIEKLVNMDADNSLESWIISQLGKK